MTVLVKMQGATYPAIQLVFIRAMIGLIFILPLIWRHRRQMARFQRSLAQHLAHQPATPSR